MWILDQELVLVLVAMAWVQVLALELARGAMALKNGQSGSLRLFSGSCNQTSSSNDRH